MGPAALARWVEREVRAASVADDGALGGSSSASTRGLRIVGRDGRELRAVAKVFDRPVLTADDRQAHVRLEADRLERVRGLPVPTPECLAADHTGRALGAPLLVMTRLRGVPLPRPTIAGWIDGLAATLTAIATAGVDVAGLPDATPWRDPTLDRPGWFGDHGLWDEAMARADAGLVGSPPRFIHRDFHTLNVLWHAGRVSGVVDWLHACRGPIEIDLASCRVNVALTAGIDAANAFTLACGEPARGYDPVWDLDKTLSLAAYPDVLLTGNSLGAGLTLDGACATLVEMTRRALG